MNPISSNEKKQALSNSNRSQHVLVIDARICLLDSLSQAIGNHSDIEVSKASCIEKCISNLPCHVGSATHNYGAQIVSTEFQMVDLILYCIGANAQDAIAQDIATLSYKYSNAAIVLVSERSESWIMNLIISNEIAGVVPASFSTSQLVQCIRLIHSGVSFAPTDYASTQASQQLVDSDELLSAKLTPRQREVLRYVSLGKSNKYIAAELSLSESTVKVHVHEVMKRLGATSRTHASYIVNNLCGSDEMFETQAAAV